MKIITKEELQRYFDEKDIQSIIIHDEQEMITPRLYAKGIRQKYTTIEIVFRETIVEQETLDFYSEEGE